MPTSTMAIVLDNGASTSYYINTYDTGMQAVPTVDPYPGSQNFTGTGSADGGFPLVAVIILGVAGGLIAILLAYRLYRWSWRLRRSGKSSPMPLPTAAAQIREKILGGGHGRPSGSMLLPSDSHFGASSAYGGFSRKRSFSSYTSPNLEKDGAPDFDVASPQTPGSAGPFLSSAEQQSNSPHTASHSQQNASRSSLSGFNVLSSRSSQANMSAQRRQSQPMLAHMQSASSASASSLSSHNANGQQPFVRPQRLSGAPHSPFSRVEIVPPQPLGRHAGNIIAEDKSTLNFSAKSGIAGGEDTELLFDPNAIMPTAGQTDFAQAKAAYLAGGSQNDHSSGASGLHSRSSSFVQGGPFQDQDSDSNESGIRHMPSASFRVDSPAPSGMSNKMPMEMPTSPLEKLQQALQAGRLSASAEDSSEDTVGSSARASSESMYR